MSDQTKQGRTGLGWGVAALPTASRERHIAKNGTSPVAKPSPKAPHAEPRPPAGGSAVPPPAGQKK